VPSISPNRAVGIFAILAITRPKQARRDKGISNDYLYFGTPTLGETEVQAVLGVKGVMDFFGPSRELQAVLGTIDH
jgi:hypothetical protein